MGQIARLLLRRPLNDRAFTLVELILVMAIVLVLVSIALPPIAETVRSVRLEARFWC